MKRYIPLLLLCFCALQIHAQMGNTNKAYQQSIDDYEKLVKQFNGSTPGYSENNDSLRFYALKALDNIASEDYDNLSLYNGYVGSSYCRQWRYDSALVYYKKTYQLALKDNNGALAAQSCAKLMDLNARINNIELAETFKNKMIQTLDTMEKKDAFVMFFCYSHLSIYHFNKSMYQSAQESIFFCIDVANKVLDTTFHSSMVVDYVRLHIFLYHIYKKQHNLQLAHQTLLKVKKYQFLQPTILFRLSSAFTESYLLQGMQDSAFYHYNLLFQNTSSTGKDPLPYQVQVNLRIGKFYLDQKDYSQAAIFLNKAAQFVGQTNVPALNFKTELLFGILEYHQNNYKLALPHLQKAYEQGSNFERDLYVETLWYLAQTYDKLKKQDSAIHFLNLHSIEFKKFSRMTFNSSVLDLETKYRLNEKNQEIARLSSMNLLRDLQLKNERTRSLIFILGCALLLVIIALLVIIYVYKNRSNKILSQKNCELDSLNKQLKTANESKSKLISIISHDLRAPIGKVSQFIHIKKNHASFFEPQILQQEEDKIELSIHQLLITMDELLLWSKSQMEKFMVNLETFQLLPIIEQNIKLLQPIADSKNITIESKLKTDDYMNSDENLVTIIHRNILNNAIKYSNAGSKIIIEYEDNILKIKNANKQTLSIEQLNNILHSNTITSQTHGLGLSLCSNLALHAELKIYFTGEDDWLVCNLEAMED